jgi:hypothetical protein
MALQLCCLDIGQIRDNWTVTIKTFFKLGTGRSPIAAVFIFAGA